MNATVQALRAVDAIDLPDNFAKGISQKPTGQQKGERLEDACRVESAFCSQAIADTLRKEATDLSAIAEERAELDRREAGIKATAKSEVAHLEQRQRRAQAYLAG